MINLYANITNALEKGWYRGLEMTKLSVEEYEQVEHLKYWQWSYYELYFPHDTQPSIILRAKNDSCAIDGCREFGTTMILRRDMTPIPLDPQEERDA